MNLALNITGKNAGYHRMQSIFAFLNDIYDELVFFPDREFSVDSAKILGVEDNLITMAWKILRENFDLKIPHVEVRKNIPICGGLGGGSSDAACFVNTVFDFWKFSKEEKLSKIGLFRDLGADGKVFLFKYFTGERFVYINGTGLDGEIVGISLDLDGKFILLINDGTRLSTKDVFQRFTEPFCLESPNPEGLIAKFHNSLQEAALSLAPSLEKILKNLSKTSSIFYVVSGSGATCFALYENRFSAELAASAMSHYPFVRISRI